MRAPLTRCDAHNNHEKNSTLIVRLISTAQTGFFYTTQRPRLGPKLAAVKYDPLGPCVCVPSPSHPIPSRPILSSSVSSPFPSFSPLYSLTFHAFFRWGSEESEGKEGGGGSDVLHLCKSRQSERVLKNPFIFILFFSLQ
jgi:hypothetical protein